MNSKETKKKRGVGKPEFVPTDEQRAQVTALATFGVAQPEICTFIGISLPTLHKHFRAELDNGAAKAQAAVGKFLFTAASGKALDDGAAFSDCLRAAMFYAKTRMGWKETQNIDHTTGGEPLQPSVIEIVAPKAKD